MSARHEVRGRKACPRTGCWITTRSVFSASGWESQEITLSGPRRALPDPAVEDWSTTREMLRMAQHKET